ncbi:MAG: rRNA maturation RNase YbeY [Planctomycetota bacterium]
MTGLSPDGLQVTFHLDTPDADPPAAGWLEIYLDRAARLAGVTNGTLSVTLIDDTEMTRLHDEYCGDPTTTDVLTFDLCEPGQPASYLEGDLVVCRDEAERQAASRGHDARTELLLYAVHGLLHLLGEDDHEPDDYQRMHRREDELLTALGFGPVFGSGAGAGADSTGETR